MPPDNTDSHQTPKRRKVAESCRPCRAKKTRCDGAHPICSSCSAKNLRCEYNAATVPVSNDILEGIESRLRKLEQQVSSTKAHIKERDHSARPGGVAFSPRWRTPTQESPSLESSGDPESESVIFGENPTTQFMREIAQMAEPKSREQQPYGSSWEHKDSTFNETDRLSMVVPERTISDDLLDSYERLVYPLFPILHMPSFRARYERLWDPRGRFETQADEVIFHATLNVVFALGCINSSNTESHVKVRTADCFYRRARKILPLDTLDHPSLGVAQYLLLMSNYLSFTKYTNRCCNTLAVAIRVCQILGLQMRRRVWHICLVLERLYSSVFGLKPMIKIDYAVPLPIAIDDRYLSDEGMGIQPTHVPSVIEAYIVTIHIFQVIEEARELKYSTAEQDIDLHELTQVLQLNERIDRIEGSLPPHLKSCADEIPFLQRDQAIRLQAEAVMTRILYARLALLRPYVLSAARQSLLHPATEDALPRSSRSLHSTIRTELSKTCVQAATSVISVLHGNLQLKSRILSCLAVFMTLAAATIVIAASLVSELGVSLDDVGPNNATLTLAVQVMDEHMRQIEGGKRVKDRLLQFLETVRRENERRLSVHESGQDLDIDSMIEEFNLNNPLWVFQWAGSSVPSDTMRP
ncbi:putative transcriptional regulatory protein [Nemania diffusa]|nr:putative transcriptional regulatory protein [Nemania diffusa]